MRPAEPDRFGRARDILDRLLETDLADELATALETGLVIAELDADST